MADEEDEIPPLVDYENPQSAEDEVVAFCTDCANTIPDTVAEKDIFLQNGKAGLCPYCKGPMIPVYKSSVDALRRRRRAGGIIPT